MGTSMVEAVVRSKHIHQWLKQAHVVHSNAGHDKTAMYNGGSCCCVARNDGLTASDNCKIQSAMQQHSGEMKMV